MVAILAREAVQNDPGAGRDAACVRRLIWKNATVALLAAGIGSAVATGYFSPDRLSRAEWERLGKAKIATVGATAYQSNFGLETPGLQRNPGGYWGYYNGATATTVQYDGVGVTLNYGGVPWIGVEFRFLAFEPKAIYRVTLERSTTGSPAALIVRNRQMDLHRVQIPIGSGAFTTEFLAPGGRFDKVILAFIADGQEKPEGTLRVTSLRIERLGE